jgi:hypothetical protein
MYSRSGKKSSSPASLPDLADWETNCPDCDTKKGCLHALFCLRERCPFCHGQLATCDCRNEVLSLTAEEQIAVAEYIDDSVEPLRSIVERWTRALEEKGRVPFQPVTLEVSAKSLILVAARGALPFVRALLAAGLPVDATNAVNHSALMAAARNWRVEVVEFLLDSGADVQRQNIHGQTALHCTLGSFAPPPADRFQADCVDLLLQRGAPVNAQDGSGGTALMNAAWLGCTGCVERLLRAGAEASLRDKKDRTAQDLARARGHELIALRLASSER